MKNKSLISTVVVGVTICGSMLAAAFAQPAKSTKAKHAEEQERVVKENEVPAAALAELKKLAAGAAITQFEEEIEHGDTFYEGSWKTATGRIDALVTAAGDVVEIEETVGADSIPKAVLGAAQKAAGKDAQLKFEKKTYIMYEVHFRKNGRGHEIVYSPTGRTHEHEEKGSGEKEEEDE